MRYLQVERNISININDGKSNNNNSVTFNELDWYSPQSSKELGAFKIILAADCVYLTLLIHPFCQTLLNLLHNSVELNPVALIAHQVRGGGGDIESSVERMLREGGGERSEAERSEDV